MDNDEHCKTWRNNRNESFGYRGAILIMGAILLNVCVGAMFYDPISKHMKKQLIPREKPLEQNTEEPQSVGSPSRQLSIPQRQVIKLFLFLI